MGQKVAGDNDSVRVSQTGHSAERSLPPEILDPVRRQGRIRRRARNRPMAEPSLNRPGIVPPIRERIAAGVTQHARVSFEPKAGLGGHLLDHPGKARGREWRTTLADEDEGRRRTFTLQAPQRPQLVAKEAASPWIGAMTITPGLTTR